VSIDEGLIIHIDIANSKCSSRHILFLQCGEEYTLTMAEAFERYVSEKYPFEMRTSLVDLAHPHLTVQSLRSLQF
jgi:hypothetical protein